MDDPVASPKGPDYSLTGTTRLTLLGLLLIAGTLVWRALPQKTQAQVMSAGVLDPGPYRDTIVPLETQLFRPDELTSDQAQEIESLALQLSYALERGKAARMPSAPAKVFEFSNKVGATVGPRNFTSTTRSEWIADWKGIRDKVFKYADWFHGNSTHEEVLSSSEMTLEEGVLALQRTTSGIKQLMMAAEKDWTALGEAQVDLSAKSQADLKRLELWRLWVPRWLARVERMEADLPQPAVFPRQLIEPYRMVLRLLMEMQRVPNPGPGAALPEADPRARAFYLPAKPVRDAWLRNAGNWNDDAARFVEASRPQ